MQVISFASSKGGPGKTTLAASLGVVAMEAGERPYLIDVDPQASLLAWGARRQANNLPVDRRPDSGLKAAIEGLGRNGYTLAIIDTAGVNTAATTEAIDLSDVTLVPCRPSTLDIEAARPTLMTLMQRGRSYALVLNACPAGQSSRKADAGRALSLLGALADPPIVQRADHVDALGLGLGVTEIDSEGKAAAEMRALWQWLKRRNAHGQAAVSVA